MRIGLIGAGNMATALARGWGEPLLVSDAQPERARALADELGGEALGSNAEVAERADVVVLCHKPAQLEQVAAEISEQARAVVSILGGAPLAGVEAVYPGKQVYRVMPNISAEVRQGVFCFVPGTHADARQQAEVRALFERLGTVIELPDALIEPATALMSCGTAFFALVAEAMTDAGVRHGLQPPEAARMVVETMGGAAAVLRERDHDMRELRRRVTSPGGLTERGVSVLEAAGLRAAFDDAVDAVVTLPTS